MFPGDLIGVVYANRYATRQYEGVVPTSLGPCHLLTVGGACGEMIGMPPRMTPPTVIRPLGYLLDADGRRVNLKHWGLPTVSRVSLNGSRPTTILVIGSSMDSGKTTAGSSVVHGLARSGWRVGAAKITGTASAKDPLLFGDAGAEIVYDFTDAGYASTATCSCEELRSIVDKLLSNLAAASLDYVVLEIADGLVQRETTMLLDLLGERGCIDATIYTCNDSLGVQSGLDRLRQHGLDVVAVAGWCASSPLAAREAQSMIGLPVLLSEELQATSIVDRIVVKNAAALAAR